MITLIKWILGYAQAHYKPPSESTPWDGSIYKKDNHIFVSEQNISFILQENQICCNSTDNHTWVLLIKQTAHKQLNKLFQRTQESSVMVKDQKPFQREYQEKPKAGMAEGNAEKETSLSQPKILNGRDFIQSRYKFVVLWCYVNQHFVIFSFIVYCAKFLWMTHTGCFKSLIIYCKRTLGYS